MRRDYDRLRWDIGATGKVLLFDFNGNDKKIYLIIIYLFCGFLSVFYFTIERLKVKNLRSINNQIPYTISFEQQKTFIYKKFIIFKNVIYSY